MWVFLTRTAQPFSGETAEAKIQRLQIRMLARQDKRRREPALGERVRDGC